MKFCKDCKYYEKSHINTVALNLDRCLYDPKLDMVTGVGTPRYCDMQRKNIYVFNPCGPEAKFFEPIAESSPELVDSQREVRHNSTFIEQFVKFFKRI